VRLALLLAALGLVILVGGIAWLVTRQVVTPVRMAARIAERLSAGRLEERMRVRGEDDLARLAASFNRMATSLQRQIRQLEDLSRVQRRFVSDVSHELRTPLTTVRMAADVLHEARAGFDPSVERSAEILQAQLDRFESLLAELLEISRYDAGAAVLDAEPTDLVGIARHVIESMEPLADRRGSELSLAVPGGACVADVDSRRIERILRNLVANAIEHGEGRAITVLVACDDDAAAVAVRDHGAGLASPDVTMVFNRFWRADPARARTTGGTGLGLSIALEDAHLHNGWLQVWGAPGDGCQFRLTLPRRAGAELTGSPIPLEPRDSARRRRPVRVGEPYRTVGAPGGVRD
jgi:two-component system sensor histidine kinase MtrB